MRATGQGVVFQGACGQVQVLPLPRRDHHACGVSVSLSVSVSVSVSLGETIMHAVCVSVCVSVSVFVCVSVSSSISATHRITFPPCYTFPSLQVLLMCC
jgi:hypothetical protein